MAVPSHVKGKVSPPVMAVPIHVMAKCHHLSWQSVTSCHGSVITCHGKVSPPIMAKCHLLSWQCHHISWQSVTICQGIMSPPVMTVSSRHGKVSAPDLAVSSHVMATCYCLSWQIVTACHGKVPLPVNTRNSQLLPPVTSKGTSRQRSGKGAIRKRFPLQKPRWEKKPNQQPGTYTMKQSQAEWAAIFPIGGHSVTLT